MPLKERSCFNDFFSLGSIRCVDGRHNFLPLAHRGARVIGTDALRILVISQEASGGEEGNQDNEDNPNIDAHQSRSESPRHEVPGPPRRPDTIVKHKSGQSRSVFVETACKPQWILFNSFSVSCSGLSLSLIMRRSSKPTASEISESPSARRREV
jgi:hypothetical protein